MKSANWIDDVLAEVSHVETPISWIWWSLVTAISSSAANYHLLALKGALQYKPNLYVMLLGSSGLGKGFPVNLSKLLVQQADITRVVAGRSSVQSIVTELSKQITRQDGKEPITDSRGFIVNGELSSAIIADVDALAILTDLYDGHYNPEWTNSLKTTGKEKLKNPYITSLFGSSMAHFYDTIPQTNIEGGYIGRNLIVYEESRSKNVDLLGDDDEIDDRLKNHIIPLYSKYLVKINSVGGRVIPDSQAKGLFNEWRTGWRKNPIPDNTGFVNRVPDHVLKVGMCLALSRYDFDSSITFEDIEQAIKRVTDLIKANKMTTAGRGIQAQAQQGRIAIEILATSENYTLTKRNWLIAGHGNFDTADLDKLIETYLEMKWITRERVGVGNNADWQYKAQEGLLKFYGRK